MKKTITILGLCAGVVLAGAATQQIRIHYGNGTSETKEVSDVTKITFEESAESTDPGTKPTDPEPDPEPEVPGKDVVPEAQMVDMGLSVKWAGWNVGATAPEEYGHYYAFGEIEPKNDYTLENYQWLYYGYWEEDLDEWEYYLKLGANFSGTNYDVAHVKWGEKWRMPTRAEWLELFNNTTKTWTSINGVNGAKFTSKITGESIFIPAAGNKFDGKWEHEGSNCMLWTPEEYDDFQPTSQWNEFRNYRVDITATESNMTQNSIDYPDVGFTIRPVYGDLPEEELPSVKVPAVSEAIDLGLPSGTKWAPFNIGASQSAGTGLFLCYGEMTQKKYTHTYNYKYYDPLTDKCKKFGGDIQGTEYDSATVLWGEDWEMPTLEQMQELLDECDFVATGYGFNVKGPNGNSIYLPACGQMTYLGGPRKTQESLYYATSTESESSLDSHYGLLASRGYQNALGAPSIVRWFSKCGGKQIRPVLKQK